MGFQALFSKDVQGFPFSSPKKTDGEVEVWGESLLAVDMMWC